MSQITLTAQIDKKIAKYIERADKLLGIKIDKDLMTIDNQLKRVELAIMCAKMLQEQEKCN